jgi:ectoine hydroxylase-related dioxygenase (phytanoyl-CoA dioxygenase family)
MDYCNWQNIPELKELVYSSPAASVAQTLMGSKSITFYHEHVLTKDGGTSKETPWHQDQPYFPCDGDLNCTMWVPVDPVPLESSIRFAKGSHKWGKWFYPRHFQTFHDYDVTCEDVNGRIYGSVPRDMDSNPAYDIESFDFQPGDVCIFHMRTLHAVEPNMKPTNRRVLSFRWVAEDATFVKRPWDESPPLAAHPGLVFDQRLVGEYFPQIPTKINN